MASPLRLSVAPGGLPDDVTNAIVDAAWTIVRATFEVAEMAMSRFRDHSELTRLNRRAPQSAPISRTLARALMAADRAHRITGGRFDPRVVDALERIGYGGAPQRPVVAAAGRRPLGGDGRIVERSGRAGPVVVRRLVDLGGIGKGLALRWAAGALDGSVVGHAEPALGYLIDAGGDIVASGSPAGRAPWLIAIENPAGGSEPIAVVTIRGRGGVATSSIRRLRWEHAGRTVHHLIDPRSGEPAAGGLLAATVAGPDPAWAEVWSKALFVEGRDGIGPLARSRGLAAWWVTEDGELEMTPAARTRTAWTASGT